MPAQPAVAAPITTQTLYPNGNADAKAFRVSERRPYALEPLPENYAAVRERVWARFRHGGRLACTAPAGVQ